MSDRPAAVRARLPWATSVTASAAVDAMAVMNSLPGYK
jgi:hypothetical protein